MLPLKLGRPILKVLLCVICCVCAADDRGPKVSTTRSIQTGPDLIAEEDYAVTTRAVTGIGLLRLWHMRFQEMYRDSTLISTQPSNLYDRVLLGSCSFTSIVIT